MHPENIPAELRARKQWVCFRYDKKADKKWPFDPKTGAPAKVNDPETWGTFKEALEARCDRYPYIGYAFTEDDTWTFIDLDDKEKDQASDEQLAQFDKIINDFDSYTERSVSGRGYHIVIKGTTGAKVKPRDHVEVFSRTKRFMLCTGDVLDGRTEIHERQELLDKLVERMRAPGASAGPAPRNLPDTILNPEQRQHLQSALNSIPSDDYDTWIRMGHALKGCCDDGRGLWMDWSQQSEKWQPKDARKWETFKGDSTGYEAVFAEAQRRGWVNPRSNAARASTQYARNQSNRRVLTFRPIGSIEPQPVQWLVEGWLAASTAAAIVGPSGSGKTFLALDWALCIATGRQWNDREVQQGTVLYIPGEGKDGLVRRVDAWCKHYEEDRASIPLWVADTMPNLSADTGAKDILEARLLRDAEQVESVTGQRPALIVVDTVARALHGESDNEPKPIGMLIACMDRLREELGSTVVAIHHTGHQEKGRARGHSSFEAALDSCCVVSGAKNVVHLESKKEKDWPTPDPLRFMITPVGEGEEASCVLTTLAGPWAQPDQAMDDKKERVFQLRREGMSLPEIEKETGVPKSTADRWCKAAGVVKGSKPKT